MASINGVSIRSLKRFIGNEGEFFQGNVYNKTKLLGFFSEDSWGGSNTYEFDLKALNTPFYMYKSAIKDNKYAQYFSLDTFLSIIIELRRLEGVWKDGRRNATPYMIFALDLVGGSSSHLFVDSLEAAKKSLNPLIATLKNYCKRSFNDEGIIITGIVKGPSDFNITVGTVEGAEKERSLEEQKKLEELKKRVEEREKADDIFINCRQKVEKNFEIISRGNCMEIKSKRTGKSAEVPLVSYRDVIDVLYKLDLS